MRQGFKNMDRKKWLPAAGACCLLLIVALYFYLGQAAPSKGKTGKGNPLVRVCTVNRADMMRHISLAGQTTADANIALAPKYTGRIMEVRAQLGDHVKAGDVLMVQDTGDLDLSIQETDAATQAAAADAVTEQASYNANYLKARESCNLEQQKYERNQYLFSIGAISQDTLDTIRQEYMASQAAFDALENQGDGGSPASVQSRQFLAQKSAYAAAGLRKQREDMILRAPRDGVIGYRAAEVGALAAAGTKVFSLVDNGHVYVDCSLSENDAAVLSPGMPVEVTIDALGQSFAGQLIYVSPAMEDTAKSYTARIALDGTQAAVKAGFFARSQIDILQRANTLFVPKEAVITKNGRTTVFVVRPDHTVEQREVHIGLLNDTEEEILDGLQDGDQVALSNQDRLKDGTLVDVTGAES